MKTPLLLPGAVERFFCLGVAGLSTIILALFLMVGAATPAWADGIGPQFVTQTVPVPPPGTNVIDMELTWVLPDSDAITGCAAAQVTYTPPANYANCQFSANSTTATWASGILQPGNTINETVNYSGTMVLPQPTVSWSYPEGGSAMGFLLLAAAVCMGALRLSRVDMAA